jgi:hypothetical protein
MSSSVIGIWILITPSTTDSTPATQLVAILWGPATGDTLLSRQTPFFKLYRVAILDPPDLARRLVGEGLDELRHLCHGRRRHERG